MIKISDREIKMIRRNRQIRRFLKSTTVKDIEGMIILIVGCLIFMYIAKSVGY